MLYFHVALTLTRILFHTLRFIRLCPLRQKHIKRFCTHSSAIRPPPLGMRPSLLLISLQKKVKLAGQIEKKTTVPLKELRADVCVNSGGTLCGFLQRYLTRTQSNGVFFFSSKVIYGTNWWDGFPRASWDIPSRSSRLGVLSCVWLDIYKANVRSIHLKSRQIQTKKLDASYDKLNHENQGPRQQKKARPHIYSEQT